MIFDPNKHHRHSIRWKEADYCAEGWFSVTICTHGKRCILGQVDGIETILSDTGRLAEECWLDLPNRLSCVEIGAYVIMPNHLHGLVAIVTPNSHGVGAPGGPETDVRPEPGPRCAPGSLGAIMRSFKSESTRRIRQMRRDPEFKLWQRNYYEHIVRGYKSLDAICRYIGENPMNWGQDPDNVG